MRPIPRAFRGPRLPEPIRGECLTLWAESHEEARNFLEINSADSACFLSSSGLADDTIRSRSRGPAVFDILAHRSARRVNARFSARFIFNDQRTFTATGNTAVGTIRAAGTGSERREMDFARRLC